MGKTTEEEDHHAYILIKWRRARVTLTTQDIKGLNEKDFIIAAKSEVIYRTFKS